jgi:hypothetical protein
MLTDGIYEHLLLDAIRERRAVEQWYRANAWADWPDLRRDNRAALRALLKLARRARKAEAKAQEHREREERRVLDFIDAHGTRWIVQ